MNKKLLIAFEIIFIISAMTYYVFKEMIPEYKSKLGSSDRIVNPEKCTNIIEININDDIDYMYLIDEEKRVYHLIFYTPESLVLYNQNIENKDINEATEMSIKLLIENNYLKKESIIKVIKNNDNYYNDFINYFKNNLTKYNINTNIIEEESNFIDKANKLELSTDSKSTMISEMDYYSKELINNSDIKNIKKETLDKETSRKYAGNVYKKIEKYVASNNLDNLEINNTNLIITTIPADTNAKYFPTTNSWYYVSNKKVYSYIEFQEGNNKYGYCYKGTIDDVKEGECEVNEENKY